MTSPTVGPVATGPTTPDAAGRMHAVVARLAAGDFQGRRVGTPGGKGAAAWLVSHLESLGAQAFTDSFPVRNAVKELSAIPVLRWTTASGKQNLVHRQDFAEHLASAYTPGLVTGPIAAPDGAVAGAWVLEPSYNAARAAELADVGAAGIVLPRGTDDAGLMPKMIAGPAACPLPVLSVRTDLFEAMTATVHSGQPSEIEGSVPLRTVDVEGGNVHGIFRTPIEGSLSVLLTAHFDGVGDDPGGVRFPAACDNASGVAVVVETAQRLHGLLPAEVGLAVALLDAEEAGAHGSAHHATYLAAGTLVINMDGAAQLHQAAAVEASGPAHSLLAALDQAGRETGVALRGQAMPSDNRRYAAAGFAAVGIGMGMPGYQTPAETPNRVEAATLLAAADLITATVLHLSRTA
ncbi:M28 family metallopeptidase [Catelliglobosispora koreensis]|uniref:M28 family metallopeptidase n=1 Tax=Catelliglobosispora koreensis TaxID=129052 RepID=UPI0003703776|nr:M28 family peptidase [Catelliglobosispora koreensis]